MVTVFPTNSAVPRNSRNSVPNHSAKKKNARNSEPLYSTSKGFRFTIQSQKDEAMAQARSVRKSINNSSESREVPTFGEEKKK